MTTSKTKRKPRSKIKAAIHEAADGLFKLGLIDKQTMHSFDESCLTPVVPLTAAQIRSLREKEQVSQFVFARFLNVSKGMVSQWERGEKRPAGPAQKLLALVAKNGLSSIA